MGEKRDAKLFLWSGLFASIAVLGLIPIVFDFHRWIFAIELIILLFVGFVVLIGLAAVYNGLSFGFGFLGLSFAIMLFDMLLIYFKTKTIDIRHLATVVSSSIGFVLSVINIRDVPEEEELEDFDDAEIAEKPEPVAVPDVPAVKKTFEPGKYLASKTGKYYHAPKCDWAKKINTKNKVWFADEEEAKKLKLKPHWCLK